MKINKNTIRSFVRHIGLHQPFDVNECCDWICDITNNRQWFLNVTINISNYNGNYSFKDIESAKRFVLLELTKFFEDELYASESTNDSPLCDGLVYNTLLYIMEYESDYSYKRTIKDGVISHQYFKCEAKLTPTPPTPPPSTDADHKYEQYLNSGVDKMYIESAIKKMNSVQRIKLQSMNDAVSEINNLLALDKSSDFYFNICLHKPIESGGMYAIDNLRIMTNIDIHYKTSEQPFTTDFQVMYIKDTLGFLFRINKPDDFDVLYYKIKMELNTIESSLS